MDVVGVVLLKLNPFPSIYSDQVYSMRYFVSSILLFLVIGGVRSQSSPDDFGVPKMFTASIDGFIGIGSEFSDRKSSSMLYFEEKQYPIVSVLKDGGIKEYEFSINSDWLGSCTSISTMSDGKKSTQEIKLGFRMDSTWLVAIHSSGTEFLRIGASFRDGEVVFLRLPGQRESIYVGVMHIKPQ